MKTLVELVASDFIISRPWYQGRLESFDASDSSRLTSFAPLSTQLLFGRRICFLGPSKFDLGTVYYKLLPC